MDRPTRGDVVRTYDAIAESFDRKRETPWPEVTEFIRSLTQPSVVLDLGCGNGRHTRVARGEGHDVIGVDASLRLLTIAARREPHAKYVLGDVCALPVGDRSVSAVLATAMVHHLPSEAERITALEEIARVLRPGGRVLVSAWSLDRFEAETGRNREGTIPGPGSGDVWVPWRGEGVTALRFYHLFRDGELRDLVLRAGLRLERYFQGGDNFFAVAARNG